MDSGASIVAFVTLGLKSVSVLHKVVSRIKNGPATLEQLAASLSQLGKIMSQVKECQQALVDSESFSSSGLHHAELESAVKDCYTDLSRLECELRKLTPLLAEKAFGATWRRVKMILKHDEFPSMQATVHRHISVLGFHLQAFTRLVIANLKTGQLFVVLTYDSRRDLSLHHNSQKLIKQSISLETASLEQLSASVAKEQATLSIVDSRVKSLHEKIEDVTSPLAGYINTLSHIQEKLDKLLTGQQEVSAGQFSQLTNAIVQAQSGIATLGNEQVSVCADNGHVITASNDEEWCESERGVIPKVEDASIKLYESIWRLSRLVGANISQNPSKEAEIIIRDFMYLLDYMSAGQKQSGSDIERGDPGHSMITLARDDDFFFNRVKALLQSSFQISINKLGRSIPKRNLTLAVTARRTQINHTFQRRNLKLKTTYSLLHGYSKNKTDAGQEQLLQFKAIFDFLATFPSMQSRIILYVFQSFRNGANHSSLPMLLIYTVYEDHPPLQFARSSSLQMLMREIWRYLPDDSYRAYDIIELGVFQALFSEDVDISTIRDITRSMGTLGCSCGQNMWMNFLGIFQEDGLCFKDVHEAWKTLVFEYVEGIPNRELVDAEEDIRMLSTLTWYAQTWLSVLKSWIDREAVIKPFRCALSSPPGELRYYSFEWIDSQMAASPECGPDLGNDAEDIWLNEARAEPAILEQRVELSGLFLEEKTGWESVDTLEAGRGASIEASESFFMYSDDSLAQELYNEDLWKD